MNSIPNWIERRPHGQRREISSADLFLYTPVCVLETDLRLVMSSEAFLFPVGCVRVQVIPGVYEDVMARHDRFFFFLYSEAITMHWNRFAFWAT